jgi:hypothetical protein
MNEKVLTRLEAQAEKNTLALPCSLDADEYTQIFNEQLVKLAVQECIDTILDCSIEYCTRAQIVSEIKQHFGVEE